MATTVNMRVDDVMKTAWLAAASASGQSLTEWIVAACQQRLQPRPEPAAVATAAQLPPAPAASNRFDPRQEQHLELMEHLAQEDIPRVHESLQYIVSAIRESRIAAGKEPKPVPEEKWEDVVPAASQSQYGECSKCHKDRGPMRQGNKKGLPGRFYCDACWAAMDDGGGGLGFQDGRL